MRQDQQRKLDSLYRTQDFRTMHADVLTPLKDSAAAKQVDDAVTGIRDQITAQGSADRALAGQTSRRQALAKDLVQTHMKPIAKFARANLRGVPDFSTLRKSGSASSPKPLVTSALSMAKSAAPYAAAMTAAGFPADTVEQLTAAANALDAATIERDNTRHHRVESTKNIATLLLEGREGVKKMDAVISKQFVANDAILAGWDSASRVKAKPGSVRKTVVTPPSVPGATPVAKTPVVSGATPAAPTPVVSSATPALTPVTPSATVVAQTPVVPTAPPVAPTLVSTAAPAAQLPAHAGA
jgi:hypothetical protein